MTKQGVINNIMANYGRYGVTEKWINEQIRGGEKHGFSYQTIYTGLRMALGNQTGSEELFTAQEVAEAMGVSEDEVIQEIERLSQEMIQAGENPAQYFRRSEPGAVQQFIIPPGSLFSCIANNKSGGNGTDSKSILESRETGSFPFVNSLWGNCGYGAISLTRPPRTTSRISSQNRHNHFQSHINSLIKDKKVRWVFLCWSW